MKNVIIGAAVAAIIVFAFQAMSWMALPIHENTLKYSSEQDAILASLTGNLTETGVYAIPNLPPNSSQEQHKAFEKNMIGKPSALVFFHKSYDGMMTMQLVCGFLLDFLAAFILAYVLWTSGDRFAGFGAKLMLAVAFALFMVLQSSLMMANWWNTPWHYLSGEITDHLVGWTLGGIWLAWWMGRKQTVV